MTRLEDSCAVTYTKNDDGSSIYTVTMNPVGTKCMEVLCAEPAEYLCNLLNVRVKNEGERLVKIIIDKLIQEDRLQEMKSTEETILSYENPVWPRRPDEPVTVMSETSNVMETSNVTETSN